MSYLIVERGTHRGKRFYLQNFPVTVGRDEKNDVVIDDDEMSRFHLRIKKRGRLFILEDLDSKNSTYINGDKTLNSIIKNGDKILLGGTELAFVTAESDIHIATKIIEFDMLVAEQLGFTGPIPVSPEGGDRGLFQPVRIPYGPASSRFLSDNKTVKKIYDYHGHLLVINDLDEACRAILKYIGQLVPKASRAAMFLYSNSHREIMPVAVKHFTKEEQSLLLSQRAIEDVLARKQVVHLKSDDKQVTHPGRKRLVLPIIQNNETLAVIHIECDDAKNDFTPQEISLVQSLIIRCAPSFESLILRREMDSWMVGMIETMISTVEAKDTYTRGHSERVSRYSMAIADELKLNRELKRLLLISSLCHDIGKIGIPDNILKKASILSAEEYAEMKNHPEIGAEIIRHLPDARRFISGVKYHHERWDGTGYPDGLAGEDIPFFGRIVAIADVFDAMVSGRSYSGFMDQSEAVEKIASEKDIFDEEIVKSFVKAHESGKLSTKTSTQSKEGPEKDQESRLSTLKKAR